MNRKFKTIKTIFSTLLIVVATYTLITHYYPAKASTSNSDKIGINPGTSSCSNPNYPCVLGLGTSASPIYQNVGSDVHITGNTGIGTNAPQQNLSVNRTANFDQANANNGEIDLSFGSTSGEGIGSKRTSGGNLYGLDFYTGFTNKMSITSNGNVGIGTASPANKLQVSGNGGQSVDLAVNGRIQTGGTINGGIWVNNPNTLFVGNDNNGAIGFFTGSTFPFIAKGNQICLNGSCISAWPVAPTPTPIISNNGITLHLWAVQGVPCLQSGNSGPNPDGTSTISLGSQNVAFPNHLDAVFAATAPGGPNMKIESRNDSTYQAVGFWNGSGGGSGSYCPPSGGIMLLLYGH